MKSDSGEVKIDTKGETNTKMGKKSLPLMIWATSINHFGMMLMNEDVPYCPISFNQFNNQLLIKQSHLSFTDIR